MRFQREPFVLTMYAHIYTLTHTQLHCGESTHTHTHTQKEKKRERNQGTKAQVYIKIAERIPYGDKKCHKL